jgi:hypothetical protein
MVGGGAPDSAFNAAPTGASAALPRAQNGWQIDHGVEQVGTASRRQCEQSSAGSGSVPLYPIEDVARGVVDAGSADRRQVVRDSSGHDRMADDSSACHPRPTAAPVSLSALRSRAPSPEALRGPGDQGVGCVNPISVTPHARTPCSSPPSRSRRRTLSRSPIGSGLTGGRPFGGSTARLR